MNAASEAPRATNEAPRAGNEAPSTASYRRIEMAITRRFHIEEEKPEEAAADAEQAPPPMPSLPRQAANLVRAIGAGVLRAATGQPVFRSREVAYRLHAHCRTACRDAEGKKWYREDLDRCAHPQCGCVLSGPMLLTKTGWEGSDCPTGQWAKLLAEKSPKQA